MSHDEERTSPSIQIGADTLRELAAYDALMAQAHTLEERLGVVVRTQRLLVERTGHQGRDSARLREDLYARLGHLEHGIAGIRHDLALQPIVTARIEEIERTVATAVREMTDKVDRVLDLLTSTASRQVETHQIAAHARDEAVASSQRVSLVERQMGMVAASDTGHRQRIQSVSSETQAVKAQSDSLARRYGLVGVAVVVGTALGNVLLQMMWKWFWQGK